MWLRANSIMISILLCALLSGCAGTKIVIPSEPLYDDPRAYEMGDNIFCMDQKNIEMLQNNIVRMRKYQDELLKLLKER